METPEIIERLREFSFDLLAYKLGPDFAEAVHEAAIRLEELSAPAERKMTPADSRTLGFNENHNGTPMIRSAVNRVVAMKPNERIVWMALYGEVGQEFGSTVVQAERCMRSALRLAGYDERLSDGIRRFAEMVREGELGAG